jgi:tetratricopeptide (TPR) repeat protein
VSTQGRTVEAIREALEDNRAEGEGPARNARAEGLAEEAERTGDRPLLIEALFNLLTAYNYSSESDKKFVPFARALRMWDENPADFDEFAAHSLHWYFKWVSSGMLDQPHIPLAAIEKWQAEMAHRYHLAGHSERAVRQSEFRIARHVGDTTRAERAHAAWQSADRDEMSDCAACERHMDALWHATQGREEKALAGWRPVLDGELSCAHQPHAALAASLLPLLRLGRTDTARAHHLRGYRMVRTMESMRWSVARHVEFCALTGNEARGLEILAAHPGHATATGDPDGLMDYLAVTALLTGRLVALGHAGQPVPGPGAGPWTAARLHEHARQQALDLAARFDARNGSAAVSDTVRARLAQQPLVDRLPLGLRATPLAGAAVLGASATGGPDTSAVDGPSAAAGTASGISPATANGTSSAAPAADTDSGDVTALVAEARRLSEVGHPRAHAAWAAAEAATARTGIVPDDLARAEFTDHAAMAAIGEPDRSAGLFLAAADQFETAGDHGEAAACRARAAYARAMTGAVDEALLAADEQCARLGTLLGIDRATPRQHLGALLMRCRILLQVAADPGRKDDALAAVAAQAEDAAALGERHRGEPGVAARLADATVLLGRLAAGRHDGPQAVALLGRAAALHLEAGQPWHAVEPEAALAELCLRQDDPAAAAQWARSALAHGDEVLEAPHRAHLHMLATQAYAALGQDDAVVRHALEAAQWADDAGDSEGLGASARLRLGGALRRLGRAGEAAPVLESVMPDLELTHDEGEYVQARWWLAESHLDLGEAREAAEQFLLAARVAEGWDDPHDHAMLANLAADALNRAGLHEEAVRAYARAEELWRTVGAAAPAPGSGDPQHPALAVVRTLRARAWIELHDGRGGLPAARAYMTGALLSAREALAAAGGGADAVHLATALADTYRQTAEIVLRAAAGEDEPRPAHEEALSLVDEALAILTPLGAACRDDRAADLLLAARLEAALSRPAAARARAEAAAAATEGSGSPAAASCRDEVAALLAHLPAADPV